MRDPGGAALLQGPGERTGPIAEHSSRDGEYSCDLRPEGAAKLPQTEGARLAASAAVQLCAKAPAAGRCRPAWEAIRTMTQ
jgi:hypothetical protein